jgi:hypothetical protein
MSQDNKVKVKNADRTLVVAVVSGLKSGSQPTTEQRAALGELKNRIESQLAEGKEHTDLSRNLLDQLNNNRGLSPAAPSSATITQAHYDVSYRIGNPGALDAVVEAMAQRLQNYVELEDATAEFKIKINEGSSNKASRSGYTIKLTCTSSAQPSTLFKILAPHIVAIYDEMDSDYDEDVESFLMDI